MEVVFLDLPVSSSPPQVLLMPCPNISCSIYNVVAFIGIAVFYFPEKHHKALPGSKWDILKKVDFVGALLSIAGVTLL